MISTPPPPAAALNRLDVVLNDAATLVQFASEATGLDAGEVAKRLVEENARIGGSVWQELQERKIAPFQWSEALVKFYQTTIAFVFESIVWNRSSLKQQMRQWIVDFLQREFRGPVEVLVFGDGLGFDSACLAAAGHNVSYFEVSQKAIGFATNVFKACDCEVQVLTAMEQVHAKKYDAVVCLDVLEHVPDPVQLVELLTSVLKPEGRLIVHAPFWYLSSSVGTHLASNRKYSGDVRRLYRPNGLRPVDAAMFLNPIALAPASSATSGLDAGFRRQSAWSRLQMGLGCGLLSIGRFWSLPHALITGWMLTRSLGKWPEMEQIAAAAGVAPREVVSCEVVS